MPSLLHKVAIIMDNSKELYLTPELERELSRAIKVVGTDTALPENTMSHHIPIPNNLGANVLIVGR